MTLFYLIFIDLFSIGLTALFIYPPHPYPFLNSPQKVIFLDPDCFLDANAKFGQYLV